MSCIGICAILICNYTLNHTGLIISSLECSLRCIFLPAQAAVMFRYKWSRTGTPTSRFLGKHFSNVLVESEQQFPVQLLYHCEHTSFALQQSDRWPPDVDSGARWKTLEYFSNEYSSNESPVCIQMCLHGVFVLQGKSQVLVSGETSFVASISAPLPLCSLSALSASFSLPCALTWSGRHWAACQMKRSSSSSPECSSLLCVRGWKFL